MLCLEIALSLIPGKKRVNLHTINLESETSVERDKIGPRHILSWVDWAKEHSLGLDFNLTSFSLQLNYTESNR